MRLAPLALLALLVAGFVALDATAQAPDANGPPPCGRGGGFGGAPPGSGNFTGGNRTGGGRRGGGNFTGGAGMGNFTGNLTNVTLTLDPPGPVTVAPGATATVAVDVRNDGATALDLEVGPPGGQGRGGFSRSVGMSLVDATLHVEPGAIATTTLTVTVDASTVGPCQQSLLVFVRDPATNRTALARLPVDVPAPAAASPAGASAEKKSPLGLEAPLAALALAALASRRGGGRSP